MTTKQRRMKKAVEYLQEYMRTYDQQEGYQDYRIETYIDDVVYGLGISISGRYRGASGFRDFEKFLLKHLEKERLQ